MSKSDRPLEYVSDRAVPGGAASTMPLRDRAVGRGAHQPIRGSRAAQRRQSRQSLIDAGRALCARGRFLSCSVGEIAENAGLSRAAFYLHFKSKDDLLNAILSAQLDWYVEQHASVTESELATRAGMIAWFQRFVEGFRSAGELMAQFWIVSPARELARMHQATRLRGVEILGGRLPRLRVFREDGSVDVERRSRLLLFVYQLEQVCFNIAFDAEQGDPDTTLTILAENFERLMAQD